MPATSKKAFRFFAGVASGSIKKPGLSRAKAKEFVTSTPSYKSLPNKARKKK